MSTPSMFQQAEYLAPTPAPPAFDSQRFTRALIAGFVGAVVGAIIYASFITITHIEIGYLSIGVAFLVAWAMEKVRVERVVGRIKLQRWCSRCLPSRLAMR